MIAKSIKKAGDYLKGGAFEILKLKKFLVLYFLFILFAVASFCTAGLNLHFPHWYVILTRPIIISCAVIYFSQRILSMSRTIEINGKVLFLFLLWTLAFFLLGMIIYPVIKLFSSHVTFTLLLNSAYSYQDIEQISAYIAPNIDIIIISAFMINIAFYPFLLMETSKRPLRESLHYINCNRFALCLTWFAIWAVDFVVQVTIILSERDFDFSYVRHGQFDGIGYVHSIVMQLCLLAHALCAVFAAACTASAYLDSPAAKLDINTQNSI